MLADPWVTVVWFGVTTTKPQFNFCNQNTILMTTAICISIYRFVSLHLLVKGLQVWWHFIWRSMIYSRQYWQIMILNWTWVLRKIKRLNINKLWSDSSDKLTSDASHGKIKFMIPKSHNLSKLVHIVSKKFLFHL